MLVLSIGFENGLAHLEDNLEESLEIVSISSFKDVLSIIESYDFDLIIIDYYSNSFEDFRLIENLEKNILCLFLVERKHENRLKFLKEILQFPKILDGLKGTEKRILAEEAILLSDKNSFESAFTEVWKVGDFVMKIREDTIENLEERITYQLELRECLDFLPKYYGTFFYDPKEEEKLVNFYEYVRPLKMSDITMDVLSDILDMIEEAYKKKYYGIDLKLSNFGKKNGKIYYLDEKGIGEYVPPDWVELFTMNFWDRVDEIIKRLKKR